jgi:restriction system protein
MEADVEERNAELAAIYDDIDNLLSATLCVDDYVDLETLRRTSEHPPFDRSDLEVPTPTPAMIPEPDEPALTLPMPPKGFFGRKKKHAMAVVSAEAAYSKAHAAWESEMEAIRVRRKKDADKYAHGERDRIATLEQERARFEAEVIEHNTEVIEHNRRVDTFITNLGYGTPEAVQEYVSIVVSNSAYPEHFQVDHNFTFEPMTAELVMRVLVPPPSNIPSIKAFKYKKSSDEITTTPLSHRELKDRYSSAVHKVGIRSIHEVFEADRRGLIRMISLEVGTEDTVPATGKVSYIPFLAVAAERDAFIDFDLSGVTPVATLKHLGAAISKDPYGLVSADITGIRRS